MITTTEKDLEVFEKECTRLVQRLALTTWDILYVIDETLTNANAQCRYEPYTRKAALRLAPEREEFVPLLALAKHEVLELLFADIGLIMSAFVSERMVEEKIHEAINRLMIIPM